MPENKQDATSVFGPRIISWNTTFRCNLKCSHCYLNAQEKIGSQELTTQEGKNLIDQIGAVSKPVLILSGGEPLLREDIFELACYATEKGFRVTMGTNGTLIDDETAQKLHDGGIRKVAVSIDSSQPPVHNALRGSPEAWSQAIEGIKAAIRNGVGVQVNTTVTQQNYADIDNILRLSKGLGVKDFHVFFLVPTGRGKTLGDISPLMYELMVKEILRKYAESDLIVKPTCAPQFMRIASQLGLETKRWSRGCIAGLSYCRIYPNGEVTPCPYLPIALGNTKQKSFREIWFESPILKELRDFDRLEGKCHVCGYREVCGGCRARAYGLSSDYIDVCGGLHQPHELSGNYLAEEPWCLYQPTQTKNDKTNNKTRT